MNTRNRQRVLTDRIRNMINLAHQQNNNALVIGVYGNSLFNDPNCIMPQIFKNLLIRENLARHFQKVVFAAIGKDSGDSINNFSKYF